MTVPQACCRQHRVVKPLICPLEDFTGTLTAGHLCRGVGLVCSSWAVRPSVTHLGEGNAGWRARAAPLTRVAVPGVTVCSGR